MQYRCSLTFAAIMICVRSVVPVYLTFIYTNDNNPKSNFSIHIEFGGKGIRKGT